MEELFQLQELWSELYEKKGESWLTVLSGSMAPTIQIGDRVLVKSVEPGQIRFGDIIVFKEADRFIAHRAIGRRVNGQRIIFLQKGDSNAFAGEVYAENIIGKVFCIKKEHRTIELDGFSGRHLNLLLSISFYILYMLRRRRLASRLDRLFRCCLNILFSPG